MKMIKKFIVAVGVLALAACGGDGGGSSSGGAGGAGGAGGGGGGGSTFDAATVGETLGNTICGFMDRCLPDVKAAFFGANCAENMATSFTLQSGAQVAAAIEAGRIVFDGAAYTACMDRIGGLQCDGVDMAFLESLNDCGVAFVGQVADGDACVKPKSAHRIHHTARAMRTLAGAYAPRNLRQEKPATRKRRARASAATPTRAQVAVLRSLARAGCET